MPVQRNQRVRQITAPQFRLWINRKRRLKSSLAPRLAGSSDPARTLIGCVPPHTAAAQPDRHLRKQNLRLPHTAPMPFNELPKSAEM